MIPWNSRLTDRLITLRCVGRDSTAAAAASGGGIVAAARLGTSQLQPARRQFVNVSLRHHFEQNSHPVPAEPDGARRRLDYYQTGPDLLTRTIAGSGLFHQPPSLWKLMGRAAVTFIAELI
jgi:hypothetical protein